MWKDLRGDRFRWVTPVPSDRLRWVAMGEPFRQERELRYDNEEL